MREIIRMDCIIKGEPQAHSVRVLHEFGQGDGYMNPTKIQEIWLESRKHDVLFSDHTKGQFEPFINVLMNPASAWYELYNEAEEKHVGLAYFSRVIPHFDATAHISLWDRHARARIDLFHQIMKYAFNKWKLRRISAEVPPYQTGLVRFTERVGFIPEGEKREAVIYKGKWFGLLQFGITHSELEEKINGRLADGLGEERDSTGDEKGSREDSTIP